MKISVKYRYIALGCLAVAVTAAAPGCSEWTEPESLEIQVPSIEEQNPELYSRYLQDIRDYKNSEHKVLIAKFDNKASSPVGKGQHLVNLPDSIDYVVLTNPDNLTEDMISEKAGIFSDKGIRTLYSISFDDIDAQYTAYVEEWEKSHASSGEEDTETGTDTPDDGTDDPGETPQEPEQMQSRYDFMAEHTDALISLADKYGYDGINVIYSSLALPPMSEETRAETEALQELFFGKVLEWKQAHESRILFFEGKPQHLIARDILSEAKYIIIPALSAASSGAFTYEVNLALTGGAPADKMIIGVTTPSLDNLQDERGMFTGSTPEGEQISAIVGAAEWVNLYESSFVKAGISVESAQNDYYITERTEGSYSNIRKAITIMNPSI